MSDTTVSASAFAGELLEAVKTPSIYECIDLSAVRKEFVYDGSFIVELTKEIANAILGDDEVALHNFMDDVSNRMAENYLNKGCSNEGLQQFQELVKFVLKGYAKVKLGLVYNFVGRYSGNTCVYFDNYIFNSAFMALIRMNFVKGELKGVSTDNFAGKAFKARQEGAFFDNTCELVEESMSEGQSSKLVNLCYNLGNAHHGMKTLVTDLTSHYSHELSFMISEIVEEAACKFNSVYNGDIEKLLIAHLAAGKDEAGIVESMTQTIRTYTSLICELEKLMRR